MLSFWYDFSSSYSYLAAMRIEERAAAADVAVAWTPFLLGPIFADAGYGGSPNLMSPAKARYMWDDIARRARHRGLPFVRPEVFPQRSVAAGRAALALPDAARPAFSRAVFRQTFVYGRDIAEPAALCAAAEEAGLDGEAVLASASDPDAKAKLFAAVDMAKARGIFGAPSFIASDGALFWGDDRLDDALSWETTGRLADAA
jgi:2-hydroxychromene-2-carboxylate isomerase